MVMPRHEELPARSWPSSYHRRENPLPPPAPKAKGPNSAAIILRLCGMILALASGTVMASGECTPGCGVPTFTYKRFGSFVYFVGCTITATILEAAAIYLQVRLAVPGIGSAGIVLVLVDIFVPALLLPATGAVYSRAATQRDQIGACARFAGQVDIAKILSLFAGLSVMLATAVTGLPSIVPSFLR